MLTTGAQVHIEHDTLFFFIGQLERARELDSRFLGLKDLSRSGIKARK